MRVLSELEAAAVSGAGACKPVKPPKSEKDHCDNGNHNAYGKNKDKGGDCYTPCPPSPCPPAPCDGEEG